MITSSTIVGEFVIVHVQVAGAAALTFTGSLLQLRGREPISTPLYDDNSNVLLWNGEIFGGLDVPIGSSDSHVLFHALTNAKADEIPIILSTLRGPWAIIFWHAATSTLWFGRDVLGKRSVLAKWPENSTDSFFLTSLVPLDPAVPIEGYSDIEPGMYCINLSSVLSKEESTATTLGWISKDCVKKVDWFDPGIESIKIFQRDPNLIYPPDEPNVGEEEEEEKKKEEIDKNLKDINSKIAIVRTEAVDAVLQSLRSAVATRCHCIDTLGPPETSSTKEQQPNTFISNANTTESQILNGNGSILPPAKVMILFSGGADSTLLAALANECLPPNEPIDLVSICFANGISPDRIAALDAFEELQSIAPTRLWRLIGTDRSLDDVNAARGHLLRLLAPSDTVMDLNIGAALWLAAAGEGKLLRQSNHTTPSDRDNFDQLMENNAKEEEEQCKGVEEEDEDALDVKRLWVRNLGRDDRLVADRGREARHPFLDENVVFQALNLPLWALTDLRMQPGVGDKLVLRGCLRRLGLERAAGRVKRAIQFGTRLAQATNAAQVSF